MRYSLAVVLIVALAFGAAGCQSVSERIGEEIGEEIVGGVVGGNVEVDGDSVTIETDEGAVTVGGDEGKIPEEFPADFPIVESKVVSASSISSEDDVNYYITLSSTDAVSSVYDWYKDEFASEGWEITSDLMISEGGSDSAMLGVEKGRMKGTLSVTAETAGSEIGIILLVEGP